MSRRSGRRPTGAGTPSEAKAPYSSFQAPLALNAWAPETLPPDWAAWRNRWELGHTLHAGFFALAFGCLATAILAETPRGPTLRA